MYEAKIIEDSISPCGVRCTSVAATMPRIILAELNTHRLFSRNSASSRAIPVEKRIQHVLDNPFVPESFGSNQKGMQAGDALEGADADCARRVWLRARDAAVEEARSLAKLGVHKQLANRLIEPFSWTTVLITATEWENYFNLRISKLAQPEIRKISELMYVAMQEYEPTLRETGEWHLPYVNSRERLELPDEQLVSLSTARSARLSYLTQEGIRSLDADYAMHDGLLTNRHMSPFEHAAQVHDIGIEGMHMMYGNFRAPWLQYRKTISGEAVAPKEKP